MNKDKLRKELNDREAIKECAELFGVVGNQTRLKICYLLCRHPELSVGDIAETIGMPISTVSHSLDKLKKVKLVSSRKESRNVFYSIVENKFQALIAKML